MGNVGDVVFKVTRRLGHVHDCLCNVCMYTNINYKGPVSISCFGILHCDSLYIDIVEVHKALKHRMIEVD